MKCFCGFFLQSDFEYHVNLSKKEERKVPEGEICDSRSLKGWNDRCKHVLISMFDRGKVELAVGH
jgi:hypothetical protein